MKKKIISFLSAFILCIGVMALPASAETIQQDGLEATLTTDKAGYTGEEQIETVLSVTNTNDISVSSVSMETTIPDGYEPADGSEVTMAADTLEAGETLTLTAILEPVVEESGSVTDDGGENTSETDDGSDSTGTDFDDTTSGGSTGSGSDGSSTSSGSGVQTGDDTNAAFWAALAILAVGICCVVLAVRKKKGKLLLPLFLILVMAGSVITAVFYRIKAAEAGNAGSVSVTETVTADGEEVTIEGVVSYVLETDGGSGDGTDQDTGFTAEDADATFDSREEEIINVTELNDGEFPYNALDDNGVLNFIDGKFSDKVIGSAEDAIDALNDIHYIMGFQNAEQEFAEAYTETVDLGAETTYYRLQQVYNNVPVYGYQLIVSADNNGEILSLSGHYYSGLDIDVNDISVAEEEAQEIVRNQDEDGTVISDGLYILTGDDGDVSLVWKLQTSGAGYLVSAGDGSILSSWENMDTFTGTGTNINGENIEFPVEDTGTGFVLTDTARNIYVYDADADNNFNFDASDLIQTSDNDWSGYTEAITAYDTIIGIYDYYANVLGRDAPDNGHQELYLVMNYCNARFLHNKVCPTAGGGRDSNAGVSYICIGHVNSFACSNSADILAHEYTHPVSKYIWTGDSTTTIEGAALSEAYSDILGSLIINRHMGVIGNTIQNRDAANPIVASVDDILDDDDDGYTNATLIDNVAYRIDQNWPEDNHADELATLFYKSMFYLTPDSDFTDCRHAVLAAAQSMHLSEEKQAVIAEAFSEVGIEDAGDSFWFSQNDSFSVTGVVKDAETGDAIVDARVSLVHAEWAILGRVTYTDISGDFTVSDFPLLDDTMSMPWNYIIIVSAKGYDTYSAVIGVEDITEAAGTEFRLGTVFLTREESSGADDEGITGYVGGTITDASTGEPLEDVTVKFRSGTDNQKGDYVQTAAAGTDMELTTDVSGRYYTAALPAGEYTLEASKDGYETAYLNVVSGLSEEYNEQDLALSSINPYIQIVRQYEEEYGELEFYEYNSSIARYTGVFLIDLVDFDQNGTDELVIGYSVPYPWEGGVEVCTLPSLDVWTLADGVPVCIYEDAYVNQSDVGQHCLYTYWNGEYYLVTGWDGYIANEELELLKLDNGEFKTDVTLRSVESGAGEYYLGNEEVDAETFLTYYNQIYSSVSYNGSIYEWDDYTAQDLSDALQEAKEQLGMFT